jgi:alpha-D-xyloside xylohydrolase
MRKIISLFFIILITSEVSSMPVSYEKLKDGIKLLLPASVYGADQVKIQVCTDEIIRVTAVKGDDFSSRKSLMVSKENWGKTKWSLKELPNELIISTKKIDVRIDKSTGTIKYYDKKGNVITSEKERDIKNAEIFGEKTFHVRQIFNSLEDETFYGLGAHQNDFFNYKGKNIDLWQYNIIDIVPFLTSSRNYGILWDNNSRTKFGDVRDYAEIAPLLNSNQISAEYFKDRNFSVPLIARTEENIAYNFIDDKPKLPEGFDYNNGSAKYNATISAQEDGNHEFRFYSSGYAYFYINDSLVVESWRQGWMPWTRIVNLNMKKGVEYNLRIEWIPAFGEAFLGLKYLSPSKEDFQKTFSLWSEVGDQIDYYFIYGNNLDEVISGYRTITGTAPMMPKWAMGFWQCRERYKTQDELLDVVREFRKRNIPIDNIVQDWFYWPEDKWGDHDFDLSRFPDASAMNKELHDKLNANIMISVWPKFYVGTKNYNAFNDKGGLYKRNVEVEQKDWVGTGYVSTFYDVYSEGARKLFWDQINEKLFSRGFDAWWLDATEPDLQSNLSDTERILRMGPTALGSASRFANSYSLMNAKGIYEGQRKTDPNKRVFILTRSAFAGQQRYSAATWSGDIASRWYDLKAQVSAGLNFALSGNPYWTVDIGGFSVEPRFENQTEKDTDEWRELNTRWFQLGAFLPLFRSHGQFPYREIYNIAPEGHPAYNSMVYYNKLRYRLMPYIYSLTGMVTQKNSTIMRPLIMDFPNDNNVLNIGTQFMFGPALMINPVTEYKSRSREIYLPKKNNWFELKSGKYFKGGETLKIDVPYEEIPIFVKAGSIIPFGPEIQYVTEKPADPIDLYVYTGNDASFDLYEDENVNYNYEKGAFTIIRFEYSDKTKTLTIEKGKGSFPGMLKDRNVRIHFVNPEENQIFNLSVEPDAILKYSGKKLTVVRK